MPVQRLKVLLSSCLRPPCAQIAEVVARWTGIPVSKLTASDRERLLHLADHLAERVVGQDEAVRGVADAIVRSRGGMSAAGRPSSFLFAGPTGTGKTELCKALAAELFDDENHIVRIDCKRGRRKHGTLGCQSGTLSLCRQRADGAALRGSSYWCPAGLRGLRCRRHAD